MKRTIKIKILKNDNTHYADMESILVWGRGKRTELTKTEGNALQRGLKIGKHTYAPTYLEGENMNLMHNYSRFFS